MFYIKKIITLNFSEKLRLSYNSKLSISPVFKVWKANTSECFMLQCSNSTASQETFIWAVGARPTLYSAALVHCK